MYHTQNFLNQASIKHTTPLANRLHSFGLNPTPPKPHYATTPRELGLAKDATVHSGSPPITIATWFLFTLLQRTRSNQSLVTRTCPSFVQHTAVLTYWDPAGCLPRPGSDHQQHLTPPPVPCFFLGARPTQSYHFSYTTDSCSRNGSSKTAPPVRSA